MLRQGKRKRSLPAERVILSFLGLLFFAPLASAEGLDSGRSDSSGISYRLAEKEGRRIILSSDGTVIPWAAYTNSAGRSVEDWAKLHEVFLEAGVSLYQLNLRPAHDPHNLWDNPFFSLDGKPLDGPRGPVSWSEQAAWLIEKNPDVRFIMRFGMATNPEWRSKHLDEFQTLPPGKGTMKDDFSVLGSLASELYLDRMVQMTRDAIRWCESQPWRDRIVGYSIFPYGEGTLEVALFNGLFDNSRVMNDAFRKELREKYRTNAALQEAWREPEVTLETASVPTREEWLKKKSRLGILHWPDPELVRRERDYFELQKKLFHRFWTRIFDVMAEATAKRPCLKGYDILKQGLQGWLHDAQFDALWDPDTLDTYPHVLLASGSLGAAPLLDHKGLDMLQTPGMYYNRAMGYAWEAEGLSDSLTLRGKVNFTEADLRTWVRRGWGGLEWDDSRQVNDAGAFLTPGEMQAGFDRTHAWALTRNQMYYFTSVTGSNWWYHDPVIAKHIARLAHPPLQADGIPWAEIRDVLCMVIDDDAALFEDFSAGFQFLAVFRQIEEGLALSGIPYRIHLLSDLRRKDFPDYKCYLFPNLFRVDAEVEGLLREKILRNGNVAIFGPGTGLNDGEKLSAEPASRLLGVPMELIPKRTARRVILQNHGHPISKNLETTTFGDAYSYGPLLLPSAQRLDASPQKPSAPGAPVPAAVSPLGAGFYHYFLDRPGPFVSEFGKGARGRSPSDARGAGDYAVVFVPTAPIPSAFLRECARYAGCHVWSERNAVVYASEGLAALHVPGAGSWDLKLPAAARVSDLFDKPVPRGIVNHIPIETSGPETRIFRLSAPGNSPKAP